MFHAIPPEFVRMVNVCALPTVKSVGRIVANRDKNAATTCAWIPRVIRTTVETAARRVLNKSYATNTVEAATGTGWNAVMVNVCALLTTLKLNITIVMAGASLEVWCAATVVQGKYTRAPQVRFAALAVAALQVMFAALTADAALQVMMFAALTAFAALQVLFAVTPVLVAVGAED